MKLADMDMLHGGLAGKLLAFTLPVALSSMVQQLFNAADIVVVGFLENADALAAVGTNTEIIALIVTVSSGLSIGANVLLAGHIGRGGRCGGDGSFHGALGASGAAAAEAGRAVPVFASCAAVFAVCLRADAQNRRCFGGAGRGLLLCQSFRAALCRFL